MDLVEHGEQIRIQDGKSNVWGFMTTEFDIRIVAAMCQLTYTHLALTSTQNGRKSFVTNKKSWNVSVLWEFGIQKMTDIMQIWKPLLTNSRSVAI
jgi:hypothetical protein